MNLKFVVLILVLISAAGCRKKQVEERIVNADKIGKIKDVLILGNSIVQHDPRPDVGWTANWGMAASSKDSDFVHVLIRNILTKDTSVKVQYKNIADFEVDYRNYALSKLDSFKSKLPDLIIVRISENVNPLAVYDNNFVDYYDKLLKYLDPNDKAVKIVTDGFWPSDDLTKIIKGYASYKHYQFIHLTDLYYIEGNTAEGLFPNPDVAKHPGNKGMRAIAESIWSYINVYFP